MCLKKKNKTIAIKEQKLLSYINYELQDKEQPICISFGKDKKEFRFCGQPYYYYADGTQDFSFAKEQINRAFKLLKESLVKIKDYFSKNNVDNKVVVTKIKQLLKLEQEFQEQIKLEQIRHQQNAGDGFLFTTISLFEELSRRYMENVISIKEQLLEYIKKNFVDFDIVNTISKVLKEQPTILPKELRDYKYNINGYSIVYNVENFLRVLIIVVLKRKPIKQILNKELNEYVKEQKEKENSNKWCDERFGGDLFYLTFNHLVNVIEHNRLEFEKAKIKIEKIKDPIEKFGEIRNKLAHNNLLTEKDLNILKTNSEMIYKYFKDFQEEIKEYKFNLKGKK